MHFKNELLKQKWDEGCEEEDINKAYDKYLKLFKILYHKNCSVR